MHPKVRLQEDLKLAMRGGDATRRDVLRMLQSAIRQVEVDTRTELSEQDAIKLLMAEVKRRRESLNEAREAGREEIAEREALEIAIIESYLPTQWTREELEAEVRRAIEEAGATTAKEMGAVMKILTPRVQGRAEGKLVSDTVRALLGG
jgi:hypothetical protein